MKQILQTPFTYNIQGFILILISLISAFQRGNAQHCTPGFLAAVDEYTVIFDDQSTADGEITSYAWDFGDGQTSAEQNPTHTYASAGTYNVCLTIIAHNPGCTATYCHHIVIHGPPPGVCHAAFTSVQTDIEEPVIDFTDGSTSEGIIGSWLWDFGDGNTSSEQNPSHTYAGPGTYTVCLTITDVDGNCTNHVCHDVTVHHPPAGNCHAAYTVHQADPDVLTFDFTDQSTSDGTIGTWSWDFGDQSTSSEQNPSHTYAAPGTYLVCLTIIDDNEGCSSHFCHELVVHHPPAGNCHAAFVAHQTDPEEQTITFTDQSTSDGTIGSWSWDFGDGNTSTEQNPVHTYLEAGTYLVCLAITDDDGSCTSHVCHNIVVHHPSAGVCHALFAAHQPDPNELVIDFTDLSTSDGTIGSWLWEFGDGNTSTDQNPSYTYSAPGTYLVCLFITDDDGSCTSHYCHHVVVHHPPEDVNNIVYLRASISASDVFDYNLPADEQYDVMEAQPLHRINSRIESGSSDHREDISVYPNPFVSTATLQYELSQDAAVKIEIYDMLGNRMRQMVAEKRSAGRQSIIIAADNLNAGYYLIKMTVGGEICSKRIAVIK